MNSFYTKKISDEVCKALHEVNFPFPIAEMGFTVPQIVEMPVNYASVLDWLISKDIFISIDKLSKSSDCYWAFHRPNATSVHATDADFNKSLDKVILLAIEFLKNDNL